jgi:hypothetical protein
MLGTVYRVMPNLQKRAITTYTHAPRMLRWLINDRQTTWWCWMAENADVPGEFIPVELLEIYD